LFPTEKNALWLQLGATDEVNAFWNGWEQVRMMFVAWSSHHRADRRQMDIKNLSNATIFVECNYFLFHTTKKYLHCRKQV
jgi:hypothetical protein